MSDQRSDATSGDLPTLFEKDSAVESTDKTISILSAVTGRDGVHSAPRKKSSSPGFMRLGVGLAAALIGASYWHFNKVDFDPTHQTATPQRTSPTPHIVQTTKAPVHPSAQMQPPAPERVDIAVVETVKETPQKPTPLTTALKEPLENKISPVAKRASSTRPLPPLTKSPSSVQRKRSIQNQSIEPQDNGTSMAFIKKPPPASTSEQQSVVVVRSAADTDVKLLEGILRLMRRDDTQDKSAMQTTK